MEKKMIGFRKASSEDIASVVSIYQKIHEEERKGKLKIGWLPDVYPVENTARSAFERQELFVFEEEGKVKASAIINQSQVDVYADGTWRYPAKAEEVMVLHTLVVSPDEGRKGIGSKFVDFYETYAEARGCRVLRMDTNEKNAAARSLYRKLGYREAGAVPCVFNGIPNVNLILLEKELRK